MVLVGNGGAEQRHNAIAQHLIHRALEAVHGLHHQAEGGVQELLGRFGSRPSMSLVESLMSAKKTVTCLRSPSRAGRAARSCR